MDPYFRTPKRNGDPKKPGKVWVAIERNPRERESSDLLEKEREILNLYKNKWDGLLWMRNKTIRSLIPKSGIQIWRKIGSEVIG